MNGVAGDWLSIPCRLPVHGCLRIAGGRGDVHRRAGNLERRRGRKYLPPMTRAGAIACTGIVANKENLSRWIEGIEAQARGKIEIHRVRGVYDNSLRSYRDLIDHCSVGVVEICAI